MVRIRQVQKRLGTKKLRYMMSNFLEEHGIGMGRDGFFDLLRGHAGADPKKKE